MTRTVQNKLKDIANITWSFRGRHYNVREDQYYYYQAQVSCRDGTNRIFNVGDCVYVDAGDDTGNSWICQIVEMYRIGNQIDEDDDDFQIVHDSTASNRMRTVLRWLYHPHDIMQATRAGLRPEFTKLHDAELYFSDHIEFDGNALEVIDGRAFLFQSVDELKRFSKANVDSDDTSDRGFWNGDKVHLVRYFYGTQASNPPPVRELEKNELKYLLEHPTTDAMYKRSRTARRGGYEPVLKGTGRKNSAAKFAALRRDSGTAGEITRQDEITAQKNVTPVKRRSDSIEGIKSPPSKRRSESVERPKSRRTSDGSDGGSRRRAESTERDSKRKPRSKLQRQSSQKLSKRRETVEAVGGHVDESSVPRRQSSEIVEASGGHDVREPSTSSPSRRRSSEIVEAVGEKEKKKKRRESQEDVGAQPELQKRKDDVEKRKADEKFDVREILQKRLSDIEKQKAEIERRKKEISEKQKVEEEKRKQSMAKRKSAEQKMRLRAVNEEETQNETSEAAVAELVKSFESMSVRQKKYCLRNFSAHVELVIQKMNERGLDWSISEANKKLVVQDVVRELLGTDT